ncbi:MAG: exodeoxyribonuclease VII large subunit [bacterium]|nr:exodeoxyribonuclease VII large subunit [bacterium]
MDGITYTVGSLARSIGQAMARGFPDEIWVQGEIRDLSRASSGHVYFTLVDTEPDDSPAAILPVTLFESDKVVVNRVLSRSGAVRMTDGVEVRIRGRLSHYAARGTVQLRMTWIDTDFTLGRLAAERARLIASLTKSGLLELNRSLAIPLVPLRIGLVTSVGSAAHADFADELDRSGFAWKVRLFDARVQGVDAVGDVVRGLATLGTAPLDAIAMVRGGGAQTDLAAFDSEEIAVAIANCPVPVLTGIGHEIDVSVADLVARSFKTPTACGAGLVALVTDFVDRLDWLAVATARGAASRLGVARHRLETSAQRLARSSVAASTRAYLGLDETETYILRGARHHLRRETGKINTVRARTERGSTRELTAATAGLDRMSARVGESAGRAMKAATARLGDLEHRLSLLDPARLLAKGWSITRTDDGELVTSPETVAAGTTLQTTVAGGNIESVVTDSEELSGG